MKKNCPDCQLVNFADAVECARCGSVLGKSADSSSETSARGANNSKLWRRVAVCAAVVFTTLFGFYMSLILTSKPLAHDEKAAVFKAVGILDEKGFSNEVFLLKYLTSYRGNDNWLNASTKFESAYAATNYPLEIMTIYPLFFDDTFDDIERAAILLHEAQHLKGADEKQAYEFVWRNRRRIGWTKQTHGDSLIWKNIRIQTKEYAPELFKCDWMEAGDCTE